MVLDININK